MSQSRNNDDDFSRDPDAWSEAYRVYLPVFYGILGRLARQGFVARASQGLEIIHDFFTDVWLQLAGRYDPEQGTMDAYVTGAFARFARRRLVREAYWFRNLEADLPEKKPGKQEPTIDPIDRKRLRQAVAALSSEDQKLLQARYGQKALSERELSREHGWTRYRVRDRLAQALIRVSCQFGDSGVLSQGELAIAQALFCDGHPVHEVARSLKLTESQVRQARARILKSIGDAVGGSS